VYILYEKNTESTIERVIIKICGIFIPISYQILVWSIIVINGRNIKIRKAIKVDIRIQIIACFSVMRCMKNPRTKLPLIVAIVTARKKASMKETFKKLTATVMKVRMINATKTLIYTFT
jgi:hypothetical protein